MKLFHGSNIQGLNSLKIGTDNKQGFGIYLTDSIEQAKYFGKYGSIYTVQLNDANILDYSNEELMREVFRECLESELFNYELNCLINGSGNYSNIINFISEKNRDIINERLSKYNVHKIKSLGFRGHFNYIVKDESICEIINEEII